MSKKFWKFEARKQGVLIKNIFQTSNTYRKYSPFTVKY